MEETVETSDSIELTQEEKDALAVQMNHIETARQEKLRKAKDSMIKKKVSIIKSILLLVDTQIDYYSKQKDDSEEETKKHTDALTSLREIISRNFDELVTILDGEDHPMVDTIRINLSSIDSIIKQFTPEQKTAFIKTECSGLLTESNHLLSYNEQYYKMFSGNVELINTIIQLKPEDITLKTVGQAERFFKAIEPMLKAWDKNNYIVKFCSSSNDAVAKIRANLPKAKQISVP